VTPQQSENPVNGMARLGDGEGNTSLVGHWDGEEGEPDYTTNHSGTCHVKLATGSRLFVVASYFIVFLCRGGGGDTLARETFFGLCLNLMHCA